MNRLLTSLVILTLTLSTVSPVVAEDNGAVHANAKANFGLSVSALRHSINAERKALQKKFKSERKDLQQKFKNDQKALREKMEELKENVSDEDRDLREELRPATISVNGELTALASTTVPTTLTLRVDSIANASASSSLVAVGSSLSVKVEAQTVLARHFWGRSSLSEFALGDKLLVIGTLQSDGTLNARVVKDDSIMLSSARGTITAVSSASQSFTLQRDPLIANSSVSAPITVQMNAATAISVPGIANPVFADLALGNRVLVNGVLNSRTNVLTAKKVSVLLPVAIVKVGTINWLNSVSQSFGLHESTSSNFTVNVLVSTVLTDPHVTTTPVFADLHLNDQASVHGVLNGESNVITASSVAIH